MIIEFPTQCLEELLSILSRMSREASSFSLFFDFFEQLISSTVFSFLRTKRNVRGDADIAGHLEGCKEDRDEDR